MAKEKCYDCGSPFKGRHTTICELAGPNDIKDLPVIDGSQYWNGKIPGQLESMAIEMAMEQIQTACENALAAVAEAVGKESMIYGRAATYWYKQILYTVEGCGSMVTMKETLDDIKEELGC